MRGTDTAIWRRLLLIPFAVEIPEPERDPTMPEKLRAELAGILQWALEGCAAWRSVGLDPPPIVRAASAEYRDEQDTIGHWIEERCSLSPSGRERAADLHRSFRDWAEACGERPISPKALGAALGIRPGIRRGKQRGAIVYNGIQLRQPGDPQAVAGGEARGPFSYNCPREDRHSENLEDTVDPPPTSPQVALFDREPGEDDS